MKLIWKVIGATAAAAAAIATVPFSVRKDEATGERTIEAMMWNAKVGRDGTGARTVAINIGFTSPFKKESDHFDDEALYSSADPEESEWTSEEGDEPLAF